MIPCRYFSCDNINNCSSAYFPFSSPKERVCDVDVCEDCDFYTCTHCLDHSNCVFYNLTSNCKNCGNYASNFCNSTCDNGFCDVRVKGCYFANCQDCLRCESVGTDCTNYLPIGGDEECK